ncbi:Glycopeptide antibiotics resistance protein [Pseudonocardia thermophila]|jgi:Glycopeptide antibiotics resistance protein|uniref:Glycopeptide antibiotics resistance protein n=1 Tax=Pseudonocardia thermophila TaxID=1848 RepID=A0A1M6NIJ4_PSETH|nr:VanZ family protein [Pseudonocardia thermophila]SHJ95545.1 Glycopeptide antibiotics resistance protein [Pseudonocardia thermophila]
MTVRIVPAVIAVVAGAGLAMVLLVPYVAASYRRRGELGWGRALLAAAALVYALALVAYVLLPLPSVEEACRSAAAAAGAQLRLFAFVDDVARYAVANPLRNPAIQQVLFNVALFVPLGAFLRHLGGRSVAVATLVGFGVSLLVEFTQLTGVWFLFPCPYRLFDVDDLLANTAGALLGASAGPLLRYVPGQRRDAAPPTQPRPVTVSRRLLGVLCDLLGVWLTGAVLMVVLRAVLLLAGESLAPPPQWLAPVEAVLGGWLPWLLLFVIVPSAGTGGTLGQRAVLLRPAFPDGAVPGPGLRLARSLLGVGGYVLLQNVEQSGGLAFLWGLVGLVGIVCSTGHRGVGGWLTGTVLLDRRAGAAAPADR